MKLPVSWLRDYVDVPSPLEEVANRLAVATAEVDRIIRRGIPDTDGNLGLFKIGRVLEAGKHPNADRLQLCQVDVGEGNPRQIVCGAWNFGPGATVAVALPGAVLPDGRTLERAKLRGTVSDGMILSEQELELGTDASGILVLDDGADPGTPLADVLPVAEEILEIEVTGNRPDLLSVYGMAREIAALYELELRPPPGAPELPRRPGSSGRDRGSRRLPALRRPPLLGRSDRSLAGVATRASFGSGGARDLERRRRDQLRDARSRKPAARLRRLQAGRGANCRTKGAARARSSPPSTARGASLIPPIS